MRNIFNLTLGLAGFIVALELVLRLVPVTHGWSNPPLTADMPLVHEYPRADYTYSRGWNLRDPQSGTFNNLGYPALDLNLKKTFVSVIGDSFVEAAMIPLEHRLGTLLAAKLSRQVGAFGVSGADLADYVIAARWAASHNAAREIIIVISNDDLIGGPQAKLRGYWYSQYGNTWQIEHGSDHRAALRNALTTSRLFSYMLWQLKAGPQVIWQGWRRPDGSTASDTSDVAPSPTRPTSAQRAVAQQFVRDLLAVKAAGHRVILVFDADHSNIYRGHGGPTPEWTILGTLAQRAGLETINLSPVFEQRFRKDRTKFDFWPEDTHWNSYGHEIVAEAISAKLGH